MSVPHDPAKRLTAARLAVEALKEPDYNARRSALQRAVRPIFDEKFDNARLALIHRHSEFIRDGDITMTAAPSNFVQRLHPDVCVWVIARYGEDDDWHTTLRQAFVHKTNTRVSRGSYSFGYPIPLAPSIIKDSIAMVTAVAAAPAAVKSATFGIPLSEVTNLIDALEETGFHENIIKTLLEAEFPAENSSISAAFALRSVRGPRAEPLAEITPKAREIMDVVIAASDKAEEPEDEPAPAKGGAMPVFPTLNDANAGIVDSVMSAVGLPSIKQILEQANAAAKIKAEYDDLASRPAKIVERVMPMVVPAATSGALPPGKVVMKNAADVCGVTDPKRRPLFDFDVPTGEWDFDHPYVPALDEDYIFAPATLVPMLLAIRDGTRPWLRGHTGTGKTTFVEQVYARLNLPLYRVNLDSDITRSELVGRDTIKQDDKGGTVSVFVEGIIPRVMQEPCGLLLDEIDASRPELGFVLQRLTEGKGFMLLEDGGRTIMPNPYFRLFATANTNGRGDETGLYTGTRVLGSAFVDRFKPFLTVNYIDAKSEMKLVTAKAPTLPKTDVERIVGYAKEHRIAFGQAQVTLPCSPRQTVGLAQTLAAYLTIFPDAEARIMAFEHMVTNAADADDAVVLKGIADRTILVGAKSGAGVKSPSF